MSVSYSTIKEISQTDNMATLLSEQVLKPVLPSVQVKSVKTKQGRRYEANVGEERPFSIYGKVQHSKRGETTYQVMKALWDLPARSEGELVLAEPLAYYPDEALLLQSALEGEEVAGDRHSEIFLAQCEAAGRMVGHIHASKISVGQPHNVDLELERLYRRLDEFKLSAPRAYMPIRS